MNTSFLHYSISDLLEHFLTRHRTPESFQNWREAVIPQFPYLQRGEPATPDADTLKKWRRSYERWQKAYEGFLAIEQHLKSLAKPMDESDRRNYESFAALLLHSGQWHAILLTMLKDVPEPQRVEHLAGIDRSLAELRTRIADAP